MAWKIVGLLNKDTYITIISPKSWCSDSTLWEVNIPLLKFEALSQIKQNKRKVRFIGPEVQIEKLKSYVADRAMNFMDMICFSNGKQINITQISEIKHKIKIFLRKILKRIIKKNHKLFSLYISRALQLLTLKRY